MYRKMAKKCLPGVICIENVTFVLFIILIAIGIYIFYTRSHMYNHKKSSAEQNSNERIIVLPSIGISARRDPVNDPYVPPLKQNDYYHPTDSSDIRGLPPTGGIPVNIQTRGLNTNYQQVGILTRNNTHDDMILPLMGRRIMSGRDKWQYYTMTNTGNLNTKLPISLNGKSCTNEYGCDDINNGDMVYVEGYKDTFRVTMYENNLFSYIPSL
jgi:hypothetical protein